MKPLSLQLMALLLSPSVGASPSGEEFLVEDITEIREAITIQNVRMVAPVRPLPASKLIEVVQGAASWYGPGFYGRTTANGERFSQGTLTAAHRTLPFGTKVRVTNLWNGRTAVIRINDRGPFIDHRVIDLGHGAASHLGLTVSGIAQVKLEVLR